MVDQAQLCTISSTELRAPHEQEVALVYKTPEFLAIAIKQFWQLPQGTGLPEPCLECGIFGMQLCDLVL